MAEVSLYLLFCASVRNSSMLQQLHQHPNLPHSSHLSANFSLKQKEVMWLQVSVLKAAIETNLANQQVCLPAPCYIKTELLRQERALSAGCVRAWARLDVVQCV